MFIKILVLPHNKKLLKRLVLTEKRLVLTENLITKLKHLQKDLLRALPILKPPV